MIALARRSALPGFGAALSVTVVWLSLIVLIPLAALMLRPWELGIAGFWHSITEPRVLAALRLSFGAATLAAVVNVPLGLLIAERSLRLGGGSRRRGSHAISFAYGALRRAVCNRRFRANDFDIADQGRRFRP